MEKKKPAEAGLIIFAFDHASFLEEQLQSGIGKGLPFFA